jgi:hypothetical protein
LSVFAVPDRVDADALRRSDLPFEIAATAAYFRQALAIRRFRYI